MCFVGFSVFQVVLKGAFATKCEMATQRSEYRVYIVYYKRMQSLERADSLKWFGWILHTDICQCWANGKFSLPGGISRQTANNNNLLKTKESLCPVAVTTTPEALPTRANSGINLISFLPSQTATKRRLSAASPSGPPECFCVGRLVFYQTLTLCVSMCRRLLFPGNVSVCRTSGQLESCLTGVFARAPL